MMLETGTGTVDFAIQGFTELRCTESPICRGLRLTAVCDHADR